MATSTGRGVAVFDQFTDGVETVNYTASTATENFFGIHGLNANYVWACGSGGTTYFYNGTNWTQLQIPAVTDIIRHVFVVEVNNVWFCGDAGLCYQYNGTSFVDYSFATPDNVSYYSIWFADPAEGYLVGEGGRLGRWNGTSWAISTITFPTAPNTPDLYCLDGHKRSIDSKALICIGSASGQVCVRDEVTATSYFQVPLGIGYYDVKIVNRDYIYLVADNGNITKLFTYGSYTFANSTIPGVTDPLVALQYFSENDIWIVGFSQNLYRYNGNAWQTLPNPTPNPDLNYGRIWGASYNDLFIGQIHAPFVVTSQSKIYRFAPTPMQIASGATGKLWDQNYTWDGVIIDANMLNNLRALIRFFSPVSMAPRFIRIQNGNLLTSYPIGEEYEEDYLGNINGPYLFSYLVP
jgi:hypothetical protein